VLQFAADGVSGIDCALVNPADYHVDAKLATPCYANGDPTGGGSAGTAAWMVRFPYTPSAQQGLNEYLADGQVIGATWGLAYQRSSSQLFAAAMMKRHSGLGTGGLGAIYKIDLSTGTPSSTLFCDLAALGVSVGSDPRVSGDLDADKNSPNHDANAFDAVGKVGFGDLDISEDESTLWVVSLNSQQLVEIPIGLPAIAPALPGDITKHDLPDPSGANGEFRPWAIGVKDGCVYVGGVDSQELAGGVASGLHAYIYRHDPAGADGNFTLVEDFPLDYQRGYVTDDGAAPTDAEWRPWIDAWSDIVNPAPDAATYGQTIHTQPILSDIEFDVQGDMVIGLVDRGGHQLGNFNYSPNAGDTETYEGASAGDLLRSCLDGSGNFVLESNASCGAVVTAGAGSVPVQGPGGG